MTGSAYYAIDDEAIIFSAGRAGFGSIFGETGGLANVPANYRFYEGGLATIRGYRYQTVGPATPLGYTIGGLSGFNATLEARIKVMDNIGVAPFLDVGGAFVGSLPFSAAATRGRRRPSGCSTIRQSGRSGSTSRARSTRGVATIRSSSTSALDNRSDGQLPLLPAPRVGARRSPLGPSRTRVFRRRPRMAASRKGAEEKGVLADVLSRALSDACNYPCRQIGSEQDTGSESSEISFPRSLGFLKNIFQYGGGLDIHLWHHKSQKSPRPLQTVPSGHAI